MVQALVELSDNANRALNTVKAKYNLKDKGQAIEFIVDKYIDEEDDVELKPEFLERLNKIRKGKYTKFNSVEELRKATSN